VEADSGVKATKLMDVRQVLQAAAQAKDNGSGRFCMGAAWRNPKDRDMPALVEMIQGVREMGMETCMTLGMLTGQAKTLADAGLDYYNHNIDTSPERYYENHHDADLGGPARYAGKGARGGDQRLLGGIVGMGETRADRVGFIHTLATYCRTPTPKACRSTRWCR
jgi:biotin synthase